MNYILWEISWPNLLMYSATIPQYKKKKDSDDDIDDEDAEIIPGNQLGSFLGI
jgi:hypothetical protein